MPTIFSLIDGVIYVINAFLVPLVFALAFITFIFGIYRGFIATDGDRKQGRQFALWGIIGMAVMFSVWGLVNILINSVGFGSKIQPGLTTFDGQRTAPSFFAAPSRTAPNAPAPSPTKGRTPTVFGDSCTTDRDCDSPFVCINSACVDSL